MEHEKIIHPEISQKILNVQPQKHKH